jgi:hypothetical protein
MKNPSGHPLREESACRSANARISERVRGELAWHLARTAALWLLLLGGCAIHLAPDYDQMLVNGLLAANEQTETLFATLSSGTSMPFPQRQPAYDAVIGRFDALRLEATARPNPPGSQAPTSRILTTIVAKLTRLRDEDRSGSLTPVLVGLAKNSYELSFEQALTYERALQ